MIGLFQPNIYFLATFTVIHLLSCLYLTLQVYYMGCWRLGKLLNLLRFAHLILNYFRQKLVFAHVQILRVRVLVGPFKRTTSEIFKSYGFPNNRKHKQLGFSVFRFIHRTEKLCSLPTDDFHGKHTPLFSFLHVHESVVQGTC